VLSRKKLAYLKKPRRLRLRLMLPTSRVRRQRGDGVASMSRPA